jgi:hypothetical protein
MLPGIELHHESLDGRGYPYGLKGDEIPLLARVIAVADTFDALTTNRPYQRAYEPKEALKIIHSLAGKRLDPEAVAAVTAVYERGEIRVQRLRSIVAQPPPMPAAPPVTEAPAQPPATTTPPEHEVAAAAAASTTAPKPPASGEAFIQTSRF